MAVRYLKEERETLPVNAQEAIREFLDKVMHTINYFDYHNMNLNKKQMYELIDLSEAADKFSTDIAPFISHE